MTNVCELVVPSEQFRDSYSSYIAELEKHGEKRIPFPLRYPHEDFPGLLLRLKNDALGVNQEEWQVPCSTYWLVDEHSKIVGVSNLRHCLNENLKRHGGHIGYGIRPSERNKGYAQTILRETLVKASERDIKEVLVTCNKSNIASAKVIKRNGGVLQDEEFIESEGGLIQRYLILQ